MTKSVSLKEIYRMSTKIRAGGTISVWEKRPARRPPPSPPGAARPNKGGSSGGSPLCSAGRARGEPSARPGLPARPARPGPVRHGSGSGGSAGCAAGGRLPAARALPAPVSSPPPPILRPLRLLLAAAAAAAPSAPAPRCSPRLRLAPLRGLPRRAAQDGIAAGSLWEFQGEEICLHLEASAKGEDLLTRQTALAGVQKSYTKAAGDFLSLVLVHKELLDREREKFLQEVRQGQELQNPLEHYIPLFGVQTRVWHSAFTDRCRSLVERRGDGETPTSFSEKKGASRAD
ncbi:uncharacterized protein LOC121356827 [Pyrgilauda ruficollis]|uniref:uncharacterized protein LOC121356827 n=1 Tax=Pyrgilauda ruficollis TaxID=221976 RepID=UPI001B86CC81|nr:uncharacterized protein LOC121356827 [Pyrgilauda ruficollis]